MKKQFNRKKLALTTETIRQIDDSKLREPVAGNVQSVYTQYGVKPCDSLLCYTLQFIPGSW